MSPVTSAGNVVHTASGRIALAIVLKHIGVREGDSVLLPAYHCTAMVEPVVWSSATPDFYRIKADTSVDLGDIAGRIKPSTRALIVVHYFGFPQDMAAIRELCDRSKLTLIEDCAHAYFGEVAGKPLGSFSDYAIASSWKFFPLQDGGCLISRFPVRSIRLKRPGLAFEAKVVLNAFEHAWQFGRLGVLRSLLHVPLRLKERAWRGLKQARLERGHSGLIREVPRGSPEFDPLLIDKRASVFSRLILRTASRSRIITRRRENYLTLLNALAGLRGAKPLFPTLPVNVVPYVFPLLLCRPERVFRELKTRGVPIIRFAEVLWNGVDASTCPVAVDYSRRLFQFPCHQELSADELDWMSREIVEAVSSCEREREPHAARNQGLQP